MAILPHIGILINEQQVFTNNLKLLQIMTNKELVRNFLQQEGYKFEETGDLFHFKANGLNLICEVSERDSMFVRIIAPVIYSISDKPQISREKVLSICNHLVEKMKTLKAYLDSDDDVMLAVELFVSKDATDLSAVLERSLNILGQGRFEFSNQLTD